MRFIYMLVVGAFLFASCADTEKYEAEVNNLETELKAMQEQLIAMQEEANQAGEEAKTEFDATGIAIVDMEKLLTDYKGYTEASKRYESRVKQYTDELEKLAKEYQTKAEIIQNEANNFGQEYVSDKVLELQKFGQSIQTKERDYTERAQKLEADMTKTVLKKVNAYAKKYAESNGYQMILFTAVENGIFYAKDEINITEEFIRSLNDAYSGAE